MHLLQSCAAVTGLLLQLSQAGAQEAQPWVPEALPPHLEARVSVQEAALSAPGLGVAERGFINRLKLWSTSSPIKVCFFGGSQQLRSAVATIALEWSSIGAYIPLDFGNASNPRICSASDFSQIRVGFQYRGYWSLVGTDSITLASQLEQSMNFSMFDVAPPPSDEMKRVVLHEFGHALGLQHEHQSYRAPCVDEFKWDFIYTYLAGPPNYWSKETIDFNLRPRHAAGDVATEFDRNSIMLYSFPASFYSSGDKSECYTPGNSTISSGDASIIVSNYGNSAGGTEMALQQAFESFAAAVQSADIPAQQKLAATFAAAELRGVGSEGLRTGGNVAGPSFIFPGMPSLGTAYQSPLNLSVQ